MSYDIILYRAEPVSTAEIAAAWSHIGEVSAYDDYVVVVCPAGNLFAHLNNLIDSPNSLDSLEESELSEIRAITEPIYNIDIQSIDPELLNAGFLSFPVAGNTAVDNDNGFIGRFDDALHLARAGTAWIKPKE